MMLPPSSSNPDQAMVDNATSAMAAKGSRLGPNAPKPRGNGRNEAITRRLAKMRKTRNA